MFQISLFTQEDDRFASVQVIRKAVFIDEQGVPANAETDRFDQYGAPALFALLTVDGQPAAAGRLAVSREQYKIGRIAVLPSFRGLGYGEAVVKTLLTKAFSMGAGTVYVDAQVHAVGFYEKIGFSACGAVFEECGIAHRPMHISENTLCKCGGCHGEKEK